MCDEAELKQWAQGAMSRRRFAALTGVAAVAACAPEAASGGTSTASTDLKLTETAVSFDTDDGTMDAFFVHPDEGKHPAIVFWPDIGSIRDAKRNMARRLASEGYAVLVMNPYYRDVAGQQFTDFADFIQNEGFAKVRPWRSKLDADSIGRDAARAVAWLDDQPSVDTAKGVGTQGYCMGGPFTVWSAAAVPERIKAAASFHGGGLVRDDYEKSPHKVLDKATAAFLIAVAKNDLERDPEHPGAFEAAGSAAGRDVTILLSEGDHGWTVPDSPVYAKAPAEEAYAALLSLYASALA